MHRREFLNRVGKGLVAGAMPVTLRRPAFAGNEAGGRRKPNIIFILADDLGYGDLGCYGQKTIKTPNLDRFAAEGIRFTDCYAGSTVCAPSRCALMTGLHCGHARIRGNALVPLEPEDVTVAEVVKGAGYATGIVGKWGCGEAGSTGSPNRQGFDEWFGYLNQVHAHNYYPDFLWRNEEKVPLEKNRGGKRETYSHDLFTREALDFVYRHRNESFFLYLAYTIPHANNERGRDTGDGMEVPDYGPYAAESWASPQKGHAAMITRMDSDIGKLMGLLRELRIHDDTIIFFSSDNGPHSEGGAKHTFFKSGGPLRGYKRDLYEGGIRVPMLVRWPGQVPAGVTSDHVWTFWDFLPTAAELAGAPAPEGIDGISMVPALLGKPHRGHEFVYWEFHEHGFSQAVRMGDWKAVRSGTKGPLELYNLKTDIGERNNVAADHPETVARIERYLETARTESKHWPIRERKRRAGKAPAKAAKEETKK